MKIIVNGEEFNVDIANTFFKRLFGLMGKKNIQRGLLFKTKGIHTFFMRENIDIVMLDKEYKVVYYKKSLKKNRIIIKKKAYYTIELPLGSLKNISLNQKVTIEK